MNLKLLLARAVGEAVVPDGCERIEVSDLCDDSRKVSPGAIFVAVSGMRARGTDFAQDAIARGAVAVVTDADLGTLPGVRVVRVSDARKALARLAAVHSGLEDIQARGELHVIGVTGTNGKSTIAYMLRSILRAGGCKAAMFGTIQYDLVDDTVPSVLTTPDPVSLTRHLVQAHAAGARYAVMEVSSHSLDQRRTDGIVFSTAVFTNLTQDHLDYHANLDEYLLAKRRLFDGLAADAAAVVNADEVASERIIERCKARIVRYGVDHDADVRAQVLEEGRDGSRFRVRGMGRLFEVRTPLVGRHNVANGMAAAAAALAMGLQPGVIRGGLELLAVVPGRLQRVDTGRLGFDVFVDYAHTDDALRNVLRAVRPLTCGKLWCVFGCGGDRDRGKRPKMARAVAEGADAFVITSDNPRTEDPLAIITEIERGLTAADRERSITQPDRARAIAYAVERLSAGDALIIAGKGHEDYQILGTQKVHFDDVEVAQAAILHRQAGVACER